MKFLHTMLRVSDIEKSLKFYEEILELELSRTKELKGKGATLYFLADKSKCCEIELTYNHEPPENGYEHGSYFGHLAFQVDNMNKFTEKLEKHNLSYFREPFLITESGPKIAFIKDPDGIMIELIEAKS